MNDLKTDKCQHLHLVTRSVDNAGVWFYSQCKECGLEGPEKSSPHSAAGAFNKRLGKRNKADDDLEDVIE